MPPSRPEKQSKKTVSTVQQTISSAPTKAKLLPKRRFAAVVVDRAAVPAFPFTTEQKQWLLDHSAENFKPPVNGDYIKTQHFYRRVWNDFTMAFPDNGFDDGLTWGVKKGDLFECYIFGRKIVNATRHEMWFGAREDS